MKTSQQKVMFEIFQKPDVALVKKIKCVTHVCTAVTPPLVKITDHWRRARRVYRKALLDLTRQKHVFRTKTFPSFSPKFSRISAEKPEWMKLVLNSIKRRVAKHPHLLSMLDIEANGDAHDVYELHRHDPHLSVAAAVTAGFGPFAYQCDFSLATMLTNTNVKPGGPLKNFPDSYIQDWDARTVGRQPICQNYSGRRLGLLPEGDWAQIVINTKHETAVDAWALIQRFPEINFYFFPYVNNSTTVLHHWLELQEIARS